MSCSSDSSTAKLELKTIQCLMCSAKIEESVAKINLRQYQKEAIFEQKFSKLKDSGALDPVVFTEIP